MEASGLISILVGWNLFARSIFRKQSGEISLGTWKVELKSVGPGIFFSLFGTIILIYALVEPVQYKMSAVDGSKKIDWHTLGVNQIAGQQTRSFVRAINTVIQIDKQFAAQMPSAGSALLPAQKKDLENASTLLTELRTQFLVSKFGGNAIDEWNKHGSEYLDSPNSLSQDERSRLSELAPWFTETVADEKRRR